MFQCSCEKRSSPRAHQSSTVPPRESRIQRLFAPSDANGRKTLGPAMTCARSEIKQLDVQCACSFYSKSLDEEVLMSRRMAPARLFHSKKTLPLQARLGANAPPVRPLLGCRWPVRLPPSWSLHLDPPTARSLRARHPSSHATAHRVL